MLRRFLFSLLVVGLGLSQALSAERPRPLALHPDNPRYLLFRGKPTLLITSGEHYGAVLNGEFDYIRYLDELKAHGFNQTRTFSGSYFEVPGSFKIESNTLAPTATAYLGPWARSDQPGAVGGGNKFDLTRWNEAYFTRLRDFVAQAGQRGIVVELVLFCPLYDEALWKVSPMRAENNINGIGKVPRDKVFALQEKALTDVQLELTRKIVRELRDFDNVYFEVCNEPYFGGVTAHWQQKIIETIVETEKDLPHKHLIAQNIANGSARIDKPNPQVSIFNFHYASPPSAVSFNYHLAKPIGDDETGFRGTADKPYRTEAWDFLLAGGSIFSHLDYSFTVKHPDGTFPFKTSPGGGGKEIRRQLAILKKFMEGFDFVRMKPDNALIRKKTFTTASVAKGSKPGPAPTVRLLAERGKQYAAYVRDGTGIQLTLDIPPGTYEVEWVHPRTGKVEKERPRTHSGGEMLLTAPTFSEDIALRILVQKKP